MLEKKKKKSLLGSYGQKFGSASALFGLILLVSGTLNHDSYVYGDKYLGQAYFPVSVGAKK